VGVRFVFRACFVNMSAFLVSGYVRTFHSGAINPLGMIRQFFCPMDLLMPQLDVSPCVCCYVLSLHCFLFCLLFEYVSLFPHASTASVCISGVPYVLASYTNIISCQFPTLGSPTVTLTALVVGISRFTMYVFHCTNVEI
jgi:hypothetical protein